jgi:hypothetical protein
VFSAKEKKFNNAMALKEYLEEKLGLEHYGLLPKCTYNNLQD